MELIRQYFEALSSGSVQDVVRDIAFNYVLVPSNALQALYILAAYAAARFAGPWLRDRMRRWANVSIKDWRVARVVVATSSIATPAVWLILVWSASILASQSSWPHHLFTITVSLLGAWVVIRSASRLVLQPYWAKLIATTAWIVAALNILDLMSPTIAILDGMAVSVGNLRLSALSTVQGVIALALLLWAAIVASRLLERRITRAPDLTPSMQVLLSKLIKIFLVAFAALGAFAAVGIDLTAFAVFGGALGVGLGFGLQKVAANLFSGIILLLDKSIKPGDVIAIGDTYGWIKSLGARYTSVITRDNTEHIIPNEDFITQPVENWSYSDTNLRLKIPFGIAYAADPRQVIAIAIEAAGTVERIIDAPAPNCLVRGFGDNSVDLELRVWIADPQNGIANVTSEVLLALWDGLKDAGVEIPFPQRDVHLTASRALPVQVVMTQTGTPLPKKAAA